VPLLPPNEIIRIAPAILLLIRSNFSVRMKKFLSGRAFSALSGTFSRFLREKSLYLRTGILAFSHLFVPHRFLSRQFSLTACKHLR
jgi:hypothetical protein